MSDDVSRNFDKEGYEQIIDGNENCEISASVENLSDSWMLLPKDQKSKSNGKTKKHVNVTRRSSVLLPFITKGCDV